MDTLHKLAGVTEVKDSVPSSRPKEYPEPPPIPEEDEHHLSHRASRASLPLNRQPSHKSFRSSNRNRSQSNVGGGGGTSIAPRQSAESGRSIATGSDEFAWGPSHPCFPHPNPHCAPDSAEYKATRVIRVKRDWLQSGDLYPQYANLYPEILDPLVSDSDFRFLIMNINSRLERAFNPYSARAWLDSAMGVVTGFLWDDLGLTGAKKGMKSLEQFVKKWNARKASEGFEVRLVQLRRTGFMSLDFVIPDPGIDVPGGDEGGIAPAE